MTRPALTLSVQYASNAADLPTRPHVRRWVRAALLDDATVTVRFVDAIEGRALNAKYRNRDYPYSTILSAYPGADQLDQVGNTIWYNGIPTIKAKCQYLVEEGLAGIMIWSLDSDVKGEHSLLSAIDGALKSQRADTH